MKNSVKIATLASFDSASLTTSYKVVNSSGFPGPAVLVRIINNSSVDVTISYDGTTDNEYLPKGTSITLYPQAVATPTSWAYMFQKGTKVYVKNSSTGTGSIYLSVYYIV